ncbi:MAG: hypothetical protein ABII07_04210 [Patescibacteria group bacterium]|nr:hypothetical protein [Patescibacteria group bacterium]
MTIDTRKLKRIDPGIIAVEVMSKLPIPVTICVDGHAPDEVVRRIKKEAERIVGEGKVCCSLTFSCS